METLSDYLGLRLTGTEPLHRRLYHAIRNAILEGHLTESSRLPASRSLAHNLGISRNSVLQAIEQLIAEGYLVGKTGSGTYVASPLPDPMIGAGGETRRQMLTHGAQPRWSPLGGRLNDLPLAGPDPEPPRYDFRYGRVDADARLLAAWRRLVARHAADYPTDYGDPAGHPTLRRAIADYARRSRGCRCDAEQILVVNGSQQALDLVARLLLTPGDGVALEEPGYRGAFHAFANAGARLHHIPVDDEGIVVEKLPSEAQLAYVTASHQFPTGAVLSLRRRLALLAWAETVESWIVEDDYDGEFRYEGRPIEAVQGLDAGGRTLYIGTFSKILFPAARLGFLIVPKAMVHAFTNAKWWTDRHTPVLEQLALAEFISSGEFERHLRRMRKRYAERRTALLDAVERHLGKQVEITGTRAGLHLMLRFPGVSPTQLERIIECAAANEVGIYSARSLYRTQSPENALLVGYATLTPDEIAEGVRRLAQAVSQVL